MSTYVVHPYVSKAPLVVPSKTFVVMTMLFIKAKMHFSTPNFQKLAILAP